MIPVLIHLFVVFGAMAEKKKHIMLIPATTAIITLAGYLLLHKFPIQIYVCRDLIDGTYRNFYEHSREIIQYLQDTEEKDVTIILTEPSEYYKSYGFSEDREYWVNQNAAAWFGLDSIAGAVN